MTTPASIHLHIQQGATFHRRLRWGSYPYPVRRCGEQIVRADTGRPANAADFVPIDLTGCTARMQVRSEVESPDVLIELTTENGRITLGGVDGTVDLLISAADTAAIDWDGGVFDLEIVHPGGQVTRLAEGSVSVSPEVTRDA